VQLGIFTRRDVNGVFEGRDSNELCMNKDWSIAGLTRLDDLLVLWPQDLP
jgi:hypothetical protein